MKQYTLILFCLGFLTTLNAREQKRPNILFAISDDQSYAHTSFAGCTFVKTPAFDRVASEGVYFENCYAGSPGCAPSRSSIVTGRHPWQNEQSGQHASSWLKKFVPFQDELANNGYAVGRTGKGVDPFRYANDENEIEWRMENAGGPNHKQVRYTSENDERPASGIIKTNYFEEFRYFMEEVKSDKPFFFWYGAKEPHRSYEKGSWKKMGKKLSDVQVPRFLPNNDVVRGDLLDYAVEIEWFDLHLHRMLVYLESIGELENTIVIVTSDNGMPFPRAKANCYEYGAHVPFAIRYPREFPGNRIIKDPATFIDLAPTILELTQTKPKNMQPITGKSMMKLLKDKPFSKKKHIALSGRERHSCSRYENWGYPQRVIRKGDFLLIWNMKPERWPAGSPQAYESTTSEKLLPMHKSPAYADIDGSPSKTNILDNMLCSGSTVFFSLAVEKRPEFELYNITRDEACIFNLIEYQDHLKITQDLKHELIQALTDTNDPRIVGPDKEIFDSYKRYSVMRKFPKPE